jgi:acetyl-CoA acetyltransferase
METLTRARKAVEGGAFKAEIAPITVKEKPVRASSPMTSIRSRSIPPRSPA